MTTMMTIIIVAVINIIITQLLLNYICKLQMRKFLNGISAIQILYYYIRSSSFMTMTYVIKTKCIKGDAKSRQISYNKTIILNADCKMIFFNKINQVLIEKSFK